MPNEIALKLSEDEALVFFEWITQLNRRQDVAFADQAEQRVLWNVEALLEAALAEPFRDDYDEILAAARARVRDPTD